MCEHPRRSGKGNQAVVSPQNLRTHNFQYNAFIKISNQTCSVVSHQTIDGMIPFYTKSQTKQGMERLRTIYILQPNKK
jgi:hypothetical protein